MAQQGDIQRLLELMALLPPPPWHNGRTVGRTVYKGEGGAEDMIGVMDTPDLAEFVCLARNLLPGLLARYRFDGPGEPLPYPPEEP